MARYPNMTPDGNAFFQHHPAKHSFVQEYPKSTPPDTALALLLSLHDLHHPSSPLSRPSRATQNPGSSPTAYLSAAPVVVLDSALVLAVAVVSRQD
jgi:hypothetical protein